MTPDESRDHLYELIKSFDTGILITRSGGTLHGRPMALASVEAGGDLYFPTSLDSPKASEIEADPDVMATFQSGYKFVSLNGTAQVVRDRALIDKLWSEAWRIWFPAARTIPIFASFASIPSTANSGTRAARKL